MIMAYEGFKMFLGFRVPGFPVRCDDVPWSIVLFHAACATLNPASSVTSLHAILQIPSCK